MTQHTQLHNLRLHRKFASYKDQTVKQNILHFVYGVLRTKLRFAWALPPPAAFSQKNPFLQENPPIPTAQCQANTMSVLASLAWLFNILEVIGALMPLYVSLLQLNFYVCVESYSNHSNANRPASTPAHAQLWLVWCLTKGFGIKVWLIRWDLSTWWAELVQWLKYSFTLYGPYTTVLLRFQSY